MSRYVMAIDASKCLNCKACLIACQQRNAVPYGLSRNWVRETPDAGSPSGWRYQPGACMHCDKPSCVDACPTHATYKAEDGVVMVDETRCIACGSCMRACPYHARHIDPARRVVDKCDYCAASRAEGMEPACVGVCATRARVFGDADDPQSPVSKALASHPVSFVEAEDAPTKPTLAYLNDVADKHWPKAGNAGPVGFMGTVATGVRWLGALSLFGVVGVGLRQLVRPTEEASHEEKRNDS